jgi:hypothetical protein
MNVEMLFKMGKNKFIEVAKKTNSYAEFINYLEQQPNFQIIKTMDEESKKLLYSLTMLEI